MIISILGTAGRDFKSKEPVSFYYDCEVLAKESGNFSNSLDMLLQNYPNEEGYFIGTKIAIDFQKELLAFNDKHHFIEVEDDSLDDIFEKILELLNKEQGKTILDITHGFRHQPIMAIFASTLSQFLERKYLKIIYAKEQERFKSYAYIYLNEYIEITQISLLLTGFIRTLNFIPVANMQLLNHKIFEDFSKSLLSNDLRGVERNHKLLQEELTRLRENEDLKHIVNLIEKVESELKLLEMLPFFEAYQKYIVLAKMTMEKNYLIVSLAYVFESLRGYCSYQFRGLCEGMEFKDDYAKNTAVMNTICNFRQAKFGTEILKKYDGIYQKNKTEFKQVRKLYEKIRKRRNALAHINTTSNFEDIKEDLKKIIEKVEALFNEKLLANIEV
jgi:CRISPR-associated DxTHG motif protein